MTIEIGLKHYISVLRQWLWLIAIVTTICTGLTYIINTLTPLVYEASALIQVHDVSTTNNNIFTDQALAQSYALLINRPAVLSVAAQHLPNLSLHKLTTLVTDSPLDNSQIIQVRATANNPVLSADIANAVVEAFIKIQVDSETTHLREVATQLYKDLTVAKQRVYADQAQLVTLQDAHASQDRIAHQNDVLNSDQVSYNSLLTNYDQVQQQLLQVSSILTVVQTATPPSVPASPHILLNTLIAATLSLLTSIVFILLLDWIDISIKTPDDVEQFTRMKSLGSVPFYKFAASNSSSALSPLIKNSAIEQSFIGISLNVMALNKGHRSILMTSIHKKSGVSTAAANLAIMLAHSGIRVLLVDANLHNPSLSRAFKSPNTSGLTTILTKAEMFQNGPTAQLHSWLNQLSTHIPYLYFLSSGPTSATLSTQLLSPNINMFLNCLLQKTQDADRQYPLGLIDIILFDSPSLENVDTLSLASSVDTSILVINSGKEYALTLRKACAILDRFSCLPLGVIVNCQKPKHKSYFYSNHFPSIEHDKHIAETPLSNTLQQERNISYSLSQSAIPTSSTKRASVTTTSIRPTTNQKIDPILTKPFVGYKDKKY